MISIFEAEAEVIKATSQTEKQKWRQLQIKEKAESLSESIEAQREIGEQPSV